MSYVKGIVWKSKHQWNAFHVNAEFNSIISGQESGGAHHITTEGLLFSILGNILEIMNFILEELMKNRPA